MIAELLAKIGVDISDLNKAEVALKNFEKSFHDAFRRPPAGEMRAEAALGGAIRQIAAGDLPGAIESIIHRIGAIPLAAAVGFGAVVFGIGKALEAAKQLDEQFEAMNRTLGETPEAAMGMEKLGSIAMRNAEQLSKAADQSKSFWAQAGEQFKLRPVPEVTFQRGFPEESQQSRAAEVARQEAIKAVTVKQTAEALEQQGRAAIRVAEIQTAQASGDPRVTAEKKAQLEYDKQRAQIISDQLEFTKALGDADLQMTADQREQLDTAQIFQRLLRERAADQQKTAADVTAKRAAAMAEEELKLSKDISAEKAKGLGADASKNALAEIQIQHLQRQLNIQKDMAESVKAQTQAQIDAAKAVAEGEEKQKFIKMHMQSLEAGQLTFEQLSTMKFRGVDTGSMLHQSAAAAREAARLIQLSQREALAGHPAEAIEYFERAKTIKAGIPLLKESEKDPAFALSAAISGAQVFADMKRYLSEIADAVKQTGNPFLNK
jgi:hypothetical protein